MMKQKRGDLLTATETAIAHQVNCYGIAGGLAGEIFAKWPEAEHDYQRHISQAKLRQDLLGTCQLAKTKDGHLIANLFGQYHPGADTKYDALEQALVNLAKQLEEMHVNEIALPCKIGCGIGGGDWSKVLEIIMRTFGHMDVTIYRL